MTDSPSQPPKTQSTTPPEKPSSQPQSAAQLGKQQGKQHESQPERQSQPEPQSQTPNILDPVREAARLIAPDNPTALERRLKRDIFTSIQRIKPAVAADVDFETDVMSGQFFDGLNAPLQGMAIARIEGALAFYNRVGWHPDFLTTPLTQIVAADAPGYEALANKLHVSTLHDLGYVHPKHFVKALGKAEAASLWESLKRFPE